MPGMEALLQAMSTAGNNGRFHKCENLDVEQIQTTFSAISTTFTSTRLLSLLQHANFGVGQQWAMLMPTRDLRTTLRPRRLMHGKAPLVGNM